MNYFKFPPSNHTTPTNWKRSKQVLSYSRISYISWNHKVQYHFSQNPTGPCPAPQVYFFNTYFNIILVRLPHRLLPSGVRTEILKVFLLPPCVPLSLPIQSSNNVWHGESRYSALCSFHQSAISNNIWLKIKIINLKNIIIFFETPGSSAALNANRQFSSAQKDRRNTVSHILTFTISDCRRAD